MVGVSQVKLHLVHDDVQGPAVPEVHHQAPVKDVLWQIVRKAGQAELSRHHLLWAGAGKVQGGGELIKLRQGAAAQGGTRGNWREEERDEEEGKHFLFDYSVL